MNKQRKFFVDPILKEISFDNENYWMINLVNTPEFRRLSRIKQLGCSDIIFTSASHTRLSHCLGAYEITRRFINQLDLSIEHPYESKVLLCAALLHDLGHGPNSHAFEKYTGINHEEYTKKIILDKTTNIHKILVQNNINPNDVVDVLFKKAKAQWTTDLIDSQIDADRMDYLLRDSWYTGAAYGQINPSILIRGSRIVDGRLCFEEKIVAEIENLLIGRFHMYERVYNNPNTIKYEFVVSSIFKRVKELINQNYKFISQTDLIKLFDPWFKNKEFKVHEFLKLDDFVFSTFIESLRIEKDEILVKLLKAYDDTTLITVDANGNQAKYQELLKENSEYFVSIYNVKPLRIYTENPDPIYVIDKLQNVKELTKVSKIMNKLKDIKYSTSYIIQIK